MVKRFVALHRVFPHEAFYAPYAGLAGKSRKILLSEIYIKHPRLVEAPLKQKKEGHM